MKKIFLFALFSAFGFAYDELTIANALKQASFDSELDSKILYTIAKIESNFNPLIIAFVSSQKAFAFQNVITQVKPYKNKYLINLRGSEMFLKKALVELKGKGINADVGLMQINSKNFSDEEIPYIFDPHYNIAKSVAVLKQCIQKRQTLKDSIECYNKGSRRNYNNYDYYKRFYTSFLKDFA